MVILASQSPRRQELLKRIVSDFRVEPSGFNEKSVIERIPERLARQLAQGKAEEIAKRCPEDVVIGCDTIVVSPDNAVFGIPKSEEEAEKMLRALSGRTHRVITGVCVKKGEKRAVFHKTTKVTFCKLTNQEIADYLATGEPFDKAGAYGIQGYAGSLIERINGDYYNVVGLPITALRKALKIFE